MRYLPKRVSKGPLHLTFIEELLEKMQVPVDYEGPKLEIVLRTIKPADNMDDVIQNLVS